MTQQDDITQRLRDNADLDEAEHGNARVVQLERDAADEIERLRAELSKLRAPVADERAAHGYGSPADVSQRIEQYLAQDGRMNSGTQLLYEAMKALRSLAKESK
ncbi:hypothetical protein [Achromobacter xylosoxidans]|uniref:hypothetical protein n=1 Tax=Alcaligenes xylosoxydans xylosoxydans TaxID=85698 RepID=UPI003F75FC5E